MLYILTFLCLILGLISAITGTPLFFLIACGIVILLSFKGLQNMYDDSAKIIRKGFHKPLFQWFLLMTSFRFYKLFGRNNIITYKRQISFHDKINHNNFISKIGGVSVGHHRADESFRFGFNGAIGNNDMQTEIDIYTYTERDKKHEIKRLATIPINLTHTEEIIINFNSGNVFYSLYDHAKNLIAFHKETVKCKKKWGYELGLYYGGSETAHEKLTFGFSKF